MLFRNEGRFIRKEKAMFVPLDQRLGCGWRLRIGQGLFLGLLVCCLTGAGGKPLQKLQLDPAAPIVPLFAGQAEGQFDIRVTAHDAHRAQVIIGNTTESPLTVGLPKAAVAVHVLPQFNQPGNGFFQQGGGMNQGMGMGMGMGMQGGMMGMGMGQNIGGQFQPQGMNSNFGPTPNMNNFFGQGFPSVPAEMVSEDLKQYGGLATIPSGRSIALQMRTACLNYGRPDPRPTWTYQLVSVEAYSSNPLLAELLENYGERVSRDMFQAAAWHVANGLSWQQLTQLPNPQVRGGNVRLFSTQQVQQAQRFVEIITPAAEQRSTRLPPPTATAGTPNASGPNSTTNATPNAPSPAVLARPQRRP